MISPSAAPSRPSLSYFCLFVFLIFTKNNSSLSLTLPRLLKYWEDAASTREWRWISEPSSRWKIRSRKGSSAERSLELSKAAQSMFGWRVHRRQYYWEKDRIIMMENKWLSLETLYIKLPATINQRVTTKLPMLKRIISKPCDKCFQVPCNSKQVCASVK